MEINLALRGRRRSPVTVAVSCLVAAVVLLLLLTGAAASPLSTSAAASLDDGNSAAAASRQGSSSWWLWRQGGHGPAARKLLLAVGKDTNEFHVEGVRRPANGKPARAVGFNEGRHVPGSGSNPNHN